MVLHQVCFHTYALGAGFHYFFSFTPSSYKRWCNLHPILHLPPWDSVVHQKCQHQCSALLSSFSLLTKTNLLISCLATHFVFPFIVAYEMPLQSFKTFWHKGQKASHSGFRKSIQVYHYHQNGFIVNTCMISSSSAGLSTVLIYWVTGPLWLNESNW